MKSLPYLNPQESMPGKNGPTLWIDSVTACTRCHACSQVCPSYHVYPEELFSPRGREQLIRFLLEGKFKAKDHPQFVEKTIRTCTLCARCSAVCAGTLPVPHHLVALRRNQGIQLLPQRLQSLLRKRFEKPQFFDRCLHWFLALRRVYLTDLFRLFLPAWGQHLYRILPRRTSNLRPLLAKNAWSENPAQPDLIYLPSFYAQYIDASTALISLQLSKAKCPAIWLDTSSGLEDYLYGSERACLKAAKKLLLRWEKASQSGPLPLLTDSLEIYLFLKNYSFLFAAFPGWKKRAENLAAHVQFITDFSFPQTLPAQVKSPKVALDISSVLYPAERGVAARARKILRTLFGKNFVECEYSRFPLPAAASSLIEGSPARQITRENAKDVARQQIEKIYCLSGWAALELNAALHACHPTAQAKHFVHLMSDYGTVQK